MDLSFGKWIDAVKLSARHCLALLVAGLFLLLAPDPWLAKFGLLEFRLHYRQYVGIATLVFAALLLSRIFGWLGLRLTWRKNRQRLLKSLETLSPEEKRLLRAYLSSDSNTQYFMIGDGVVGGLEAKKILYRSANVGPMGKFPYNLQPWALEELSMYPSLLDTGDDDPYRPRNPFLR